MYLNGAVRNASLARRVYPGWTVRIYCEDKTCPKTISRLSDLGCEIIPMGVSIGHAGMLWRFLAAWEPNMRYCIFRDSDSRLNNKEAAAVKAWIDSGLDAHCMHDHPHHARLPMFGGMWGIKGGILQGHCPLIRHFKRDLPRVGDMRLLNKYVLPNVRNSLLRHASVKCLPEWGSTEPFPSFKGEKDWIGFVGQQYDGNGQAIWA